MLLLVGGILLFRSTRPQGLSLGKLQFTIPPPTGAALQGMLALSPDGRTLAFVATESDGRDLLYLRRLDSTQARPLPATEGAAYPFWSPDGHALGFFSQGKLKRIDLSSGSPQILCDAPAPRGGSWGSSGTIIFSTETGGQIRSVAEAGGESRRITHLASRSGESFRPIATACQMGHLERSQCAGEDAQFIHAAIFEAVVAEPMANGQIGFIAATCSFGRATGWLRSRSTLRACV